MQISIIDGDGEIIESIDLDEIKYDRDSMDGIQAWYLLAVRVREMTKRAITIRDERRQKFHDRLDELRNKKGNI